MCTRYLILREAREKLFKKFSSISIDPLARSMIYFITILFYIRSLFKDMDK